MPETLRKGQQVQSIIGHWFEVVDASNQWQPIVQPLTMIGTSLRALGYPVRVFRSDLRVD